MTIGRLIQLLDKYDHTTKVLVDTLEIVQDDIEFKLVPEANFIVTVIPDDHVVRILAESEKAIFFASGR